MFWYLWLAFAVVASLVSPYWPWIVGTILAVIFFIIFEARAFKHPDRQNTLSRAVYDIGSKWPLSIFIMGMFAGGLAVHFFWHWCPPGSVSTGWLLTVLGFG